MKNTASTKTRTWQALALTLIAASTFMLIGCGSDSHADLTALAAEELAFINSALDAVEQIPAPPTEYPAGELGYMVQLGQDIIDNTDTHPLTRDYVGNSLQCSSCHIDGGRAQNLASTFIGTAASFPAFNARDGGVVTLQDRINSCFMRSMNGIRPPTNSEAALAMTIYITWLSEGFTIQMAADKAVAQINRPFPNMALKTDYTADAAAGNAPYDTLCGDCHGIDGLGGTSYQPVWGDDSYNMGAGMATNFKHASWIQFNMPPGAEFSLGNQEALNIAAYINSHARPTFVEAEHLPTDPVDMVVYHYGQTAETIDRRAAEAAEEPVIEEPDPPVVEEPVIDGNVVFADNCAACHTAQADGLSAAALTSKITTGPHAGGTSFGLSVEEIAALALVF